MRSPGGKRRQRSGFVLILALLALAVVVVLVVALLQGASDQENQAQSDAAYAREKMLADSAVALVIGQIQQASTQPNQTWISQPGLIRTYDTSGVRKPSASYKLYSSTTMVDTSGTLNFLGTDVPSTWNSTANQSVYTDLNSPQQTPGLFGETIYPILDPAAVTAVEGISIDSGHGVEMPVMWLYQLQDGTLGPAANGTKANPIVARLAFWTDDETSKININTAADGAPWNTPHAYSADDVAWGAGAPAQGEYSRYPGHPAMTSLEPVFGLGTNAFSSQQLLALTPRYAWGGSEFGAQTTTPGQVVPPKTDRLYPALDELIFGTGLGSSGQRAASPVTPRQIEAARFVLTAHSDAPETTLLGEPRVAIWPVSDAPQDSTRTTAADRAVAAAATVGTRPYFFQRHNSQSPTDDLNAAIVPGNAQLFNDLVARASETLPGYGTQLIAKYPGAAWTQLALEITDFIRGLNAVDPSPAPFVPYTAGDASGVGRGFIVPLTTAYGTPPTTLRSFGRCPTLSSLTLDFYVCGFTFDDGTTIDYDVTPDNSAGANWTANFLPGSSRWQHVTGELVRCFVVPCTFQPGCAYPEVSEACDIQISGLNQIGMSVAGANDFGFSSSPVHSHLLSDALAVLPAERAWGGNEGPLAWRAAALDAMPQGSGAAYAFAGLQPYTVPFVLSSSTKRDPEAAKKASQAWPPAAPFTFHAVSGLTVTIRDRSGNTLQTLTLNLPKFTVPVPNILNEFSHKDGATPGTSSATWTTDAADVVLPSYYMNLKNRVLATQNSRAFFIQPGDVCRSVEAGTDLRVVAGLENVPATCFQPHPNYVISADPQAHNLRFADGTGAYGASGSTNLVPSAAYPTAVNTAAGTDWRDGSATSLAWPLSPANSTPSGTTFVSMMPVQNLNGDWDTGPGIAPDGAQINLPDAGTTLASGTAYFSLDGGLPGAATQRTPNALVPSPVAFGSLPSGINPLQPAQSEPWRTLLFCPYPAADTSHPGFATAATQTLPGTPPDYLILDHFWMPVIEPYGISTCMATAGKINLNDPIAPFTYLHRSTALHALLHDLRIPAISAGLAAQYKSPGSSTSPISSIWSPVDENATIAQLESRFSGGTGPDAYLSESEICSVPLVPQGMTAANLDSFWNSNTGAGRLTGDNLREWPYAQLYARLTTRSNSYTVHVRVQVLQKLPADPQQDVWKEGTDRVLGDWRGSYEIERYLDPAAAAPAQGQQLGPYHFRIISSRRFSP